MASKEFTIKKGHRVWIGNYPFLLTEDATGIFETITDSPDALAEALATNPSIYASHRDDLAHDEDGFENVQVQRMQADGKTPVLGPGLVPIYDIEAKPVKVHVTYGLNGTRIERRPGDKDAVDTKKLVKEQEKNVAAADKEAEKQAKLDEKLREDDELRGTDLETALKIKEEEQKMQDAKGVADAKARRDMEIANHNRSGGAAGPAV